MGPWIAIACCLVAGFTASGQSLVVDRGLPPDAGSAASSLRAGWEKPGQGLLTDTFTIGVSGEVWMIDRIRIWAQPDAPTGTRELGDLFSDLTLYGAIEIDPEEAVKCACHGLAKLKTVSLQPGSNAAGPEVQITPVGSGSSPRLWQIDFREVRWSAPGGLSLQFGVLGKGRAGPGGHPYVWFTRAAPAAAGHRLASFDAAGKPLARVEPPTPMTFNVQVWAHPSVNGR